MINSTNFNTKNTMSAHRPVRPIKHLDAEQTDQPIRPVGMTGQTGHLQNLHKYQSFSPPHALAQILLDVVFLQVNVNVLQVPACTETTHKIRSMRNYKQSAKTHSSEANHN